MSLSMIGLKSGITFDRLNLHKINNLTMNRHDIEEVLHSAQGEFSSVDSDGILSDEDSQVNDSSDFEDTLGNDFEDISRDLENVPDLDKSEMKREIKRLFVNNNVRDKSFKEEVKGLFQRQPTQKK